MYNFNTIKAAVDQQMSVMSQHELFRVDVTKDALWAEYLDSFPPGTNPIFKERTEHDCQCCKQFIRTAGGVVAVINNKLVSIWDINIGGYYQIVADRMSELVKSASIRDIFLSPEKNLGIDRNRQQLNSGEIVTWSHFYHQLPNRFVKPGVDIATQLSYARSNKEVFKRSLDEISTDAIDQVLELIEQNSIYRGEEHLPVVQLLRVRKADYLKLSSKHQDNYCWMASILMGGAAKIKNTVIGTLLVDISDGVPLDRAVASFESKVAPTNYKRPTALITEKMIKKAQDKVQELGIETALHRRYAVAEDITVNNVLFANRDAKKAMNVFDELVDEAPEKLSNLNKVEEVGVATFISNILPKAASIELMVENRHCTNLMSLIAPTEPDSKHIFKWNNNFSWAYAGDLTDSIAERVKRAGGNVDGVLRCSLAWFNYDDLDIHVIEPNKNHIYFSNKRSSTDGTLDVDMNAGGQKSRSAVENIVWTDQSRILEGMYTVYVHNYSARESIDPGFEVEIEFARCVHSFHYNKKVHNGSQVVVAKFEYTKADGIRFIEPMSSTQAPKEVWGINTQKFHKVSMILNSPNHWDGKTTGNKHLFFILDKCTNSGKARGFFNEFLNENLKEHRKVFEVLGSKMKTQESSNQLSGVGFSSTQRNHIFCKVSGSFKRTIKINL